MKQIEAPEYCKNLSLEDIVYLDPETGEKKVEEWRDISGYEGFYKISNCGRIKSLGRKVMGSVGLFTIYEKIKPSFSNKQGYRRVEISKNGQNKKFFVHRLVAIAFIDNEENKPDVNHKDGVKWNNKLSNLEWHTESQNRVHALEVLKVKVSSPWKGCDPKTHPMYGRRGGLAPSAKPIFCNENNKRYDCIQDAADDLQISTTTLKYILTGRTKKSKIPYTFRYA